MKKKTILNLLVSAGITASTLMTSMPIHATVFGWIEVDGKWTYREVPSTIVKDTLKEINGETYRFDADGYMITGWYEDDEGWSFFDQAGHMKKGWLLCNGFWYYFNKRGIMQTGWLEEADKYYCLNADGKMFT